MATMCMKALPSDLTFLGFTLSLHSKSKEGIRSLINHFKVSNPIPVWKRYFGNRTLTLALVLKYSQGHPDLEARHFPGDAVLDDGDAGHVQYLPNEEKTQSSVLSVSAGEYPFLVLYRDADSIVLVPK